MTKRVTIVSAADGRAEFLDDAGVDMPAVRRAAVKAVLTIEPGKVNKLDLTLGLVGLHVSAEVTFKLVDPSTGDLKPVRRVEFADGTSWDADK